LIAPGRARQVLWLAAALAAAMAAAGCASKAATTDNHLAGAKLTVYASVPLAGASRVSGRAVLNGIELALHDAHDRVGRYRIMLRELDDATAQRGSWDPGQTSLNVRQALNDRSAVGYIGDYDSGASAVSIPLLNRDGIPQISSASTAVGLTEGGPEAAPGEPEKYYPTGRRTFVRVVPNDAVQAAVQVKLAREVGCQKMMVLDDGEVDGRDEAESFQVAAKAAGLAVIGDQEFEPHATDYTALAQGLATMDADCVLVSAITDSNASLLVGQVAAALPHATILGSAGMAESTFTNPQLGGIPLSIDPRVLLTSPTLDPADYPPAGRRFFADYARRYGIAQPAAIYGYAAMSLMLQAIARATQGGTHPVVRSKVLAEIFATRDRPSVLGTYSINGNGDTSVNTYGVYRVNEGHMSFWRAIQG
jgi:branched-chain amino acid transport system substrate-binding protein